MTLGTLFKPNARFLNSERYRADIDGLRAIAVAVIILFHLQVFGISGGFVGVDVFFVISGYWITHIIRTDLERNRFSFAAFCERRVRRIVPSMLVAISLTIAAASFILSLEAMTRLGHSAASSLLFAANIYFFNTSNYFAAETASQPLVHLWSLGVEAQFYVLWPLMVLGMLKILPMARAWIIIAVLSAISLASSIYLASHYATAAYYLIPSRLFEFLLGAGIFWLPTLKADENGKSIADSCLLGGLVMIGLSVALYTSQTPFPSFYALLPTLGAALVIYGAPRSGLRLVVGNPVIAYLGRISYELYLFHWPIIVLYNAYTLRPPTMVDASLMLALTVLLSVATYHFISCPIRFGRGDKPAPKESFFIGITAAFVVLCAIAGSINLSHGWGWRLPADVRVFARSPEAFHQTQYGGLKYHENQWHKLGDPSATPSFILMGDSFAGQYAGAMHDFLVQHKKAALLFYVNGCLFLPTTTAHMFGKQTVECEGANARLMSQVNGNSLPIIQAQSWTSYKGGIIDGNGQVRRFSQSDNVDYYAYMIEVIEQMRVALAGRRYMIVGVSPGVQEQKAMADCFASPSIVAKRCAGAMTTKEELSFNGQEFNVAATNYAGVHPEVGFINPRAALCKNGLCYAAEGTTIYYSDRSHFTTAGALKVLNHYQNWILALRP
jgi:peptidoglycan/LPS O-acetylase OafA/YrhL